MYKKLKANLTIFIYFIYSLAIILSVGILGLFISSSMSEILLDQSITYNSQQLASIESGYVSQISHIKSISERMSYAKTSAGTTVYDSVKLLLGDKSAFKSLDEYDVYMSHNLGVYAFFDFVENVSQTQAPIFFIAGETSEQGILSVNWPVNDLRKLEYAEIINNKIFSSGYGKTNNHNCIPGLLIPDENGDYKSFYILFEYIRSKYNPDELIGSVVFGFNSENLNSRVEGFSIPLQGSAYVLYSDGTILFDTDDKTTGEKYEYFSLILSKTTAMISENNKENYFESDGKLINYIYNAEYDFYVVGEIDKKQLYSQINTNNIRLVVLVAVSSIIVIIITSVLFKIYSGYINALNNQKAQLQQRKAELKALQFQINPHFLYNTLETIRMKALTSSDYDTALMIRMLANLFRSRAKENFVIPISDEIRYCDSLLELYNIKCNGEIKVIVNVSDEITGYGILRDLLQPIIENIFIHAFNDSSGYEGCYVLLKGYKTGNYIIFEVENNSKGMEEAELKKVVECLDLDTADGLLRVGLYNVHQRIKLVYGNGCGLSITSGIDTGTVVRVKIAALSVDLLKDKMKDILF